MLFPVDRVVVIRLAKIIEKASFENKVLVFNEGTPN